MDEAILTVLTHVDVEILLGAEPMCQLMWSDERTKFALPICHALHVCHLVVLYHFRATC